MSHGTNQERSLKTSFLKKAASWLSHDAVREECLYKCVSLSCCIPLASELVSAHT